MCLGVCLRKYVCRYGLRTALRADDLNLSLALVQAPLVLFDVFHQQSLGSCNSVRLWTAVTHSQLVGGCLVFAPTRSFPRAT